MIQKKAIDFVSKQDWLDTASDAVQPAIVKVYQSGGKAGLKVKNFMHGTWLRHPLHPPLTDVPIGAWTAAAVLDGLELAGQKKFTKGADAAIGIGLVGAAGAAVAGLTDWTGTTKKRRKMGLMHGLLNLTATSLYATSAILRRRKGCRKPAIGLAMLGYGISAVSSYLGGYLVYGQQMGVDHTATAAKYPKKFVSVLPENKLSNNTMHRVTAAEVPVLLVKKEGKIFAIADTCSHLGGSLSGGELLDHNCVRCPLHGSIFSLENGAVMEGPATEPQPQFDVRVKEGSIEVRLSKNS